MGRAKCGQGCCEWKEKKLAEENQDRETLIALTSDVVAAHVSHNSVSVDQIPVLIAKVYQSLAGLGQATAPAPVVREPAVPLRASVRPDHVTCLECGRKMKMLKRHLTADHGLTTEEYRQRWGLATDHPLVAPNYADRRRDLAKAIGLGRGGRGRSQAAGEPSSPKSVRQPKSDQAKSGSPRSGQAKGAARSKAVAAGGAA